MTLVTDSVPARTGEAMRIFGLLVSLGVSAWFAFATMERGFGSFQSGEYKTGLISFPLWPGRLIIAFGFALLTLEPALSVLRRLITSQDPAGKNTGLPEI